MKPLIKRNAHGQFIEGMPFHTEETKRKIGAANAKKLLGRQLTKVHRKHIALGMKKATSHMRSKKQCADAVYQSAHQWMRRWYGQPQHCDQCRRKKAPSGKGKKDYFHWANIDGTYRKERDGWLRLCATCHRNYDFKKVR